MRYLLLGAALFALLARHSWSDAWLGDFWIYLATLEELSANPAEPRHPLFGNSDPFPFLSPYTLGLGVAAQLSGLRTFEVLVLQGLVNVVLLLGALYAFVLTWLRRRAAAFYALLFLLFLWGAEPWNFSGFFHLRSLALVLPYPSTFATALALAALAAFPRLARWGSRIWAPLAAAVLAALWIIHPLNGLFLCLGLVAWSLEGRRPKGHWLALAIALGTSIGLALAWPLYPVAELWLQQAEVVHQGNDVMYNQPIRRVWPALLGAPWLVARWRRSARDPLTLLVVALATLIVCGGLVGRWSYGRLIAHAVLLLQVALADACAALEERLARRGGAPLRHLLAPAVALLLIAVSWSSALRPTIEEAGRGDPYWLDFLGSHVGRYDVVMTDLDTCWYVPSFRGKVVAYPMQLPFVPDHAERLRGVARFFERGVPAAERLEILARTALRTCSFRGAISPDWHGAARRAAAAGPRGLRERRLRAAARGSAHRGRGAAGRFTGRCAA